MNYKGEKCFACNEEFNDNDDVVVCPDCGTPYHRECYKQQGKCINQQLHESGQGWSRTIPEKSKSDFQNRIPEENAVYKVCPNCMTKNNIKSDSCINCGERLAPNNADADYDELNKKMSDYFIGFDINKLYFGFDPNEDFDGVKLSEIFKFVRSNTLYYIPLFKKMKNLGNKISFNLTSFFFPYFYFAHRKMWLMALVSVFVTLVMGIPSTLISVADSVAYGMLDEATLEYAKSIMGGMLAFIDDNYGFLESLAYVCNIGNYIFKFAMCVFGNWMYYRFTIKTVKKIKTKCQNDARSMSMIETAGGTSLLNIFIITLIMFAGYVGFSFVFSFLAILM